MANVDGGRSSGTSSSRSCPRDRLALVPDHLLGHLDLAEGELQAEPPLDRAAARRSGSSSPASPACTSCPRTARRRRAASSGRARARGTTRRGGGRRRPRGRSCTRGSRSTSPSTRAGRRVDDRERVGVGRAERDARRGVILAGPDDPGAASPSAPGRRGRARSASGPSVAASSLRDRRLVRGRADVAGEYARVRVVEDRRLDAPSEQLVGLAHEELVERVLGRDEHREPVARGAPRGPTAGAATRRCPGKPTEMTRVEQPDVDPELERVRRRNAEQLARGEPPLDLAPLQRPCSRRGRARAASRRRAARR